MKNTWLVQRLEKPTKSINPFSFGGGYKNGGLSDKAMDIIRGIFSFDYMGAAEFEFGAVPEALTKIADKADKGQLEAYTMTIPLRHVQKHWSDKSPGNPEGEGTVYILCDINDVQEIMGRIRQWAAEDFTMKMPTNLPRALRPQSEYDTRTVGWLELDNGFFFFTDEEMWKKTCDLFGVKTK